MNNLPRIQGKAIQEKDGLWSYEIYVTIGETEPLVLLQKDGAKRFETKQAAIDEIKNMATGIAKVLSKEIYDSEFAGFFNLKTGGYEPMPNGEVN